MGPYARSAGAVETLLYASSGGANTAETAYIQEDGQFSLLTQEVALYSAVLVSALFTMHSISTFLQKSLP